MAELFLEALRNNQRQLDADGVEVGVSRQAVDETLALVESLREQLKQANLGRERALNSHRYVEGQLYAAQATIASQREWIKSAGHRPGCAVGRCAVCDATANAWWHDRNHERFRHDYQPGPCDCGWAKQMEEKP